MRNNDPELLKNDAAEPEAAEPEAVETSDSWPWYRKLPAAIMLLSIVECIIACIMLYPRIGFSFQGMQTNQPLSVIVFSLLMLFFVLLFSVYVAGGNPLLRKKYAICLVGVFAGMTIVFALNVIARYFI